MKIRGFTLIELMVTLSIVGLLVAMAMPSMSGFLKRRAVLAASASLAADLRLARAEAVKRGQRVTVCRSTNGASCAGVAGSWADGWLVFPDYDGDGSVDAGESLIRSQGGLLGVSSIQAAIPSNTRHTITFESLGIARSVNDTWIVTPSGTVPSGSSQLICISNQGRPLVRPLGVASCSGAT